MFADGIDHLSAGKNLQFVKKLSKSGTVISVTILSVQEADRTNDSVFFAQQSRLQHYITLSLLKLLHLEQTRLWQRRL